MSSSFWKIPRSNASWVQQWRRRMMKGDIPFILQEVNIRMLGRAQIMRPVDGGVLHQGWLHPGLVPSIRRLFDTRAVVVCSPAPMRLTAEQFTEGRQGLWSKLWGPSSKKDEQAAVVPPHAPLPFDSATQALIWSELWLHHVEDPAYQLQEWLRVLKPEGCVFFSCFGPDTARELSGVAAALGLALPDFPDMHDWGDLLSSNGFSDPVVEMEKLTLTYETPQALLRDWRALVGRNVLGGPKGLFSRAAQQRALQALEVCRQGGSGRIPLTLELIYAHAWKVEKRVPPPLAVVKLEDIGGRKPKASL